MQRNIQPSSGSLALRLGPVLAAFAGVIFWLFMAALFPTDIVTRIVPEAAPWIPIGCYVLALLSFISMIRRLGRALQGRTWAKAAQSPAPPSANRRRAGNNQRRNAEMPKIHRRPTVQRQR